MLETVLAAGNAAGHYAAWAGVALLCAAGLIFSAVGISGTWLVVLATAWAAHLHVGAFPSRGVVWAMAALALSVEIAEWSAGHWGVRRRGGSRLAGFAAMAGGMLGALLGLWIPIPVVGPLLGLLAGSFGLAYAVERRRRRAPEGAAHVAWGAVFASLAVLLLKIAVTLAMALWLWIGLWFAA